MTDILTAPDGFGSIEAPLFYIAPKDANPASEFQRQKTALAMLARLAPKAIVLAIPNGQRRTDWEAIRAHNEGVIAGAMDLVLWWTGGCAVVEFKAGKTMPRPNQVAMLNRFVRAGHHAAVVRDGETLLRWLRDTCGAPVMLR